MLRNKLFKYKLIKYALINTGYTFYLCALLSALGVLNTPVVHASSRCADLVSSSSFDSSMKMPLTLLQQGTPLIFIPISSISPIQKTP